METQRFAPTLNYSDYLVIAKCKDETQSYIILCNRLNLDEMLIRLYSTPDYVPGSAVVVKYA